MSPASGLNIIPDEALGLLYCLLATGDLAVSLAIKPVTMPVIIRHLLWKSMYCVIRVTKDSSVRID